MLSPGRGRWKVVFKFLLGGGVIAGIWFIPFTYHAGGECELVAGRKVLVRSEISGQIDSILVEEGEWVEKGEVIVRLMQRELRQELELAEAELRREKAKLAYLKSLPKPEEVAKAEQEVKLRETQLKYSENTFKRYTELYRKAHISRQQYEEVRRRRDSDREALELARRNLELVRSGVSPERIKAQEEEVNRLRIRVSHLRRELELTEIRAPISGRVTSMYLKEREKEMVSAGEVVAEIENPTIMSLKVLVPEEYAGEVRVGTRVWVRLWTYPDRVFQGEVKRIGPLLLGKTEDELYQAMVQQKMGTVRSLNYPEERVVPVIAEISNEEGELKSGMRGYAKIEVGRRPLGWILFSPVIRFFRVRVWSWLP